MADKPCKLSLLLANYHCEAFLRLLWSWSSEHGFVLKGVSFSEGMYLHTTYVHCMCITNVTNDASYHFPHLAGDGKSRDYSNEPIALDL